MPSKDRGRHEVHIRVDEAHRKEIEAELMLYQKGLTARVLRAEDIFRSCEELDELYKGEVPQKMMQEITYEVDTFACNVPRRYGWKFYSTVFKVKHDSKGWVLREIKRTEVKRKYEPVRWCYIPYAVRLRITNNALDRFENGGW